MFNLIYIGSFSNFLFILILDIMKEQNLKLVIPLLKLKLFAINLII